MEYLYILIVIFCFSGFSFVNKKSQLDNCNIFAFTSSFYFVGFILCFVKTIPAVSISGTPPVLLILSVAGGIASVGSFLLQLASLHSGGKLALIYIISNMSILIPVTYSAVFLNEELSITKITGIILFIVFILLLNNEMKEKAV